jgi:hypothetical protein
MMPHRRISHQSLISRIATLRRRHAKIDARIDDEQRRPMPDIARLKRLKQERLGLKDAIAMTRTIADRHNPDSARTG